MTFLVFNAGMFMNIHTDGIENIKTQKEYLA
jgi:hypothetical protein